MAEGTALIGQQMHMYNGGMYQRTQYAIKTYVPKLGHQTGLVQFGVPVWVRRPANSLVFSLGTQMFIF